MEANKMSANNHYDISIIVPVYNTAPYLQECIDSLINQTKENIEIILVNDGSKDNSREIILQNAKRYENITFVDQENKGVCIARNAGLNVAKGDYIGWLDSDDFLKPDALEKLYKLMVRNNADYGYYNICFYPNDISTKEPWYKEYKGNRDWDFIERNSQCTNTLTKKTLLDKLNIQYWFEKFYEYGWIMVLLYAEKIVSLDEKLYVYRVGHNSASGGSYIGKVPKFEKAVELSRQLPEMIDGSEYEESLKMYFQYRYIYALILLLIVSSINNDRKAYYDAKKRLQSVKYKRNKYTKIILDNNHGVVKSFVLRYMIPFSFDIARIVTSVVFRNN